MSPPHGTSPRGCAPFTPPRHPTPHGGTRPGGPGSPAEAGTVRYVPAGMYFVLPVAPGQRGGAGRYLYSPLRPRCILRPALGALSPAVSPRTGCRREPQTLPPSLNALTLASCLIIIRVFNFFSPGGGRTRGNMRVLRPGKSRPGGSCWKETPPASGLGTSIQPRLEAMHVRIPTWKFWGLKRTWKGPGLVVSEVAGQDPACGGAGAQAGRWVPTCVGAAGASSPLSSNVLLQEPGSERGEEARRAGSGHERIRPPRRLEEFGGISCRKQLCVPCGQAALH